MTIQGSPQGIDVSNHQGHVNWNAVSNSGQIFAFSKATEGTYFNDPWFARNWRESRNAGLNRGAYHFARPSSGSSPDQEAAFFLASVNHAGGLEPGDMLVLDFEDEKAWDGGAYGTLANWALGFCEYVEAATTIVPVFYTGPWYADRADFPSVPALADCPLWLAAYRATMPPPIAPWSQVSFWQYSDHGSVPGVSGNCDQNIFNGNADRIPLLGLAGDTPIEPLDPIYNVGPGIQDAMRQRFDHPATNEHYITPDWSEAYGTSGAKYTYIASLNSVRVFLPEAD